MSVGFGGLLRRLSKRDRDVRAGHHMRRHPMVSPYFVNLSFAAVFWNFFNEYEYEQYEYQYEYQGHDNYAFEMEAPKSPWRYPHLKFRDSFKASTSKMSVKFRQPGDNFPSPANGHGHHHLDLMGVSKQTSKKYLVCLYRYVKKVEE